MSHQLSQYLAVNNVDVVATEAWLAYLVIDCEY